MINPNYGKLHQAQRITFVSNLNTLFAGTNSYDLGTGQIGIFQKDPKKYFVGTTSPVAAKGRTFKIIQGMGDNYSEENRWAGVPTWDHSSIEFSAEDITDWGGTKGKPFTKENVYALGYDGVDRTKTLSGKAGITKKFYMHLRGYPAYAVQGNTMRSLKREYYLEADPLDAATEAGSPLACQVIQNKLLDQIARDKWNKIPISKLVKARPITKCDVDPQAPVTVDSRDYTVEVFDDGTDTALGLVQSQYPGIKIERIKYTGITSTYRLTQLAEASAPAAVSVSKLKALTNCSTCPSGYTKVDSALAIEVTYPAGATPFTIAGTGNQISRTKLSGDAVQDVYLYLLKADYVFATAVTNITANNGSAQVVNLGMVQEICTPPAATTYAWVQGGLSKQVSRTYVLTLKDTVCGASRLAELQAKYPSLTISVATVGTCARKYQTTVLSRLEVDETCTEERYAFDRPSTFEADPWVAVTDDTPYDLNCSCGIILEGARFVQEINDTTFNYTGHDPRDYEPVNIQVSSHSFDFNETLVNDGETPFTTLQVADYPNGWGRDVANHEQESLSYFMKSYSFHPLVREKFKNKFQTKLDLYYDEYQLRIKVGEKKDTIFDTNEILYRFFFPVGEGKAFEAAINKLVASAGKELTPVSL